MATELPVKDVLCEAMEYLSKLGANLRTRSENLKEKKINKVKLTNALAVQKAADKVLLICELSKKSLGNVEAGVRKVLEQIDVSQATSGDGGKSSTAKTGNRKREDKPKYKYFDYKSNKLKLKSKISIKHYRSVKVHATKMTLSMLEKYPIYHDCKLYRLRKQKSEELCKSNNDSSENFKINEKSDSRFKDNLSDLDHSSKPAETDDEPHNSEMEITNDQRNSSKKLHRRNSQESDKSEAPHDQTKDLMHFDEDGDGTTKTSKRKKKYVVESSDDSVDSKCLAPKNRKISCSENKQLDDDVMSVHSDKEISNQSDKSDSPHNQSKDVMNSDEYGDGTTNTSKKKKKYAVESSDDPVDSKCLEPKNRKISCSENKQLDDDVMSVHSDKEISNQSDKSESPHNQSKDVLNSDEYGDGTTNTSKKKKKYVAESSDDSVDSKCLAPRNRKISCNENKQLDDDVVSVHSDKEISDQSVTINTKGEITDDANVNSVKPLIKCVSINKLLKDNVLNTNTDIMSIKKTKKSNYKHAKFDIAKKNKMLQGMLEKKKTRDEVFWASKQKEVSEFKPKEFTINITRLPKFSVDFLRKNNLKKIIKGNNVTISYVSEETDSEMHSKEDKNQSSIPAKNDTVDEQLIDEASKVKSSLLNESDSDNNMIETSKNTKLVSDTTFNRIKLDLLNSDSDENIDLPSEKPDKNKDKPEPEDKTKTVADNNSDISDSSSKQPDKYTEIPMPDDKVETIADNDTDRLNAIVNLDEGNVSKINTESGQIVSDIPLPINDAKNSLLDDSSDNSETPWSKKQRIKDTMNAKNALLTHSDSDSGNMKKPLHSSSSSTEDLIVTKKKCIKKKLKKKKNRKKYENSDSSEEDKSSSSSRKMVRSKSKPGNSSHSSDAQDPSDKDIDGLTNLRILNKARQRNSDSSDTPSDGRTTSPADSAPAMSKKTTALIGEELLKAEASSDSDEVEAVDNDDEDLPSVTLTTGFNGGAESHLAKDDLLGESDSSLSIKDTKEESDDEETMIAKRRKAANAISSDSETAESGAARKKNQDNDARISDFDDSDDSEPTKRSKRKKKGSDSDASANSDSDGKKKRRRIKSVNDSDGSGSDSETDGKNKHGRKNIRKVMGKNQLEEATKRAARQEKERVARIQERQKMYNNLEFDESGKPDEVVLDKVLLDFDPETKEPLIAVDRGLVKKLKPHQANGIKFMWDACFESVKRIKKDKGSGCILAHCMGLGKTLQVVTLTHTLLANDELTKVHRVLVVCPLSTVLNWVNEFKMWLKYAHNYSDIDVYELSKFKQNSERAFQLSQWYEHGGVCVLGYEMFRNLSADNNKKFKKKMLKNFQESLVDPGPDLVVCDEGHLLKNEKTSLSQSMNRVKTLRRIVLTGTPLQNNLKEYYCMVQFVKPNLLGKYNEYLNRFVNPITNGQYTDSTDHDIRIMKRRSHVLHKMLDGAVQRRDYGVLAPFLPPKHEYVLFVTLSEVQTKLYQHYLDNHSRRPQPGKSSGFLFPDFQSLQRIWTHPLVLKYNSERYEIAQQKKRDKEEEEDSEGSLVNFIDDDSTPDESTAEETSDDSSECSDDSRKKSKKKKAGKKSKGKDKDKDKESAVAMRRRGTRANPIDLEEDVKLEDDIMEVKYENPTEWWIKMVEEDKLEDMRNSHKLVLLFDILRQCEAIGDKLLVFSQSLYSLDLIEHFLGKVDEATQENRIDEKLGGHVGSWSQGVDYFRLDGSTSCENRSIWCKNFNREDNPRARLFLISTRAGGLGINLVAANRVVIFDVSWNPSHDVQSIFRVYRFGQKKPCYVYRFLAMGTMEEKIYERQVTKQAISKRVIDEQQIDRHYAENDLTELYKFEPQPPTPRPLPPLPKDRLFAEMLKEHEAQIYKYHEHDSLLENKEEETLSEEERKAAWEDFENEKNRPPPAPFVSPWPMHNGMVPNMIVQQQQQLAYAALAAMLRKDVPNINDNQIRDMLPMIYNANPALMQKMSEIYKYSQMTPGMMASGMNSASGGAMGMSSASPLSYEPPWQRQQQQQQQMRLQQLMQQQQSQMGAKLYAGGLGSRDPVAMALQQQRAREIMMGGGAGRPRGRPPLQPRAAPPPSADVVNLDSD